MTPRATRPIRRLAVLVALLLPAAAGAAARFYGDDTSLVLENDRVRIVFSTAFRGAVVGLEDRDAGVDLAAGLPFPASLWLLERAAGCDSSEVSVMSGGAFAAQGGAVTGGARLELRWSGLPGGLSVRASVFLPDEAPRAEWSLAVAAGAATVLRSVAYPLLAIPAALGASGADDHLAIPLLDGVGLDEPGAALAPGEGLVGTYPADLSLQMATLWDDTTGLYLGVHDASGWTKSLGVLRGDLEGTPALLALVRHAVPEVPGAGFTTPGPVVLGPFRGDWYDAVALYANWARGALPTPPPLFRRADVPGWLTAAPPVLSAVAYTDEGVPAVPAAALPGRIAEYGSFLGLPATALLFGWEREGAWTGPAYFPPRDGSDAFRAAATALRSAGNRLFVYLSGSVWRLQRPQLPGFDGRPEFAAEGRDEAAITCAGEPLHDAFYASIGWDSVRMCPGAAAWRQRLADAVATAAGLGVGAVSVDEFPVGAVYPCHAPDHGHPPGSGGWQGPALRELLAGARARGRAVDPTMAFTCEHPGELYLDLLDGYVGRDNTPDGFMYTPFLRRWGGRFSTVPMFAAAYHDLAVNVAEPVPIYDTGFLADVRTSLSRGIAAAFVLGKVPGASTAPLASADRQLLDLLRRAARMTSAHRDLLVFGRMLRPPRLAVPEVTFAWLDTDLATGATTLREQTAPAVMAAAWESPDGIRAVALANITASTRVVDVPVPAPAFPPPHLVSRTVNGDTLTVYQGDRPPASVRVTLPAHGLALLSITSPAGYPPRVRPRLR